MLRSRVKYIGDIKEEHKLATMHQGDWIDVRVHSVSRNGEAIEWSNEEEIAYMEGDVLKFGLGFALELPSGYEAHLVPRSSTFKNYGILLTNSMGVIDNSYCGDSDEWGAMFYAIREGVVVKGDRIGQFRVVENMPKIVFEEVEHLGNTNRGGYGSTGVK